MQYLLTMSSLLHNRIKTLLESVLTETYSPDQIKDILWDSFKTYAEKIELKSEDDDKLVFTVTTVDDFDTDQATPILTDLHDSDLFDVINNGNDTFTITFFQNGVDNKFKTHTHKIYAVGANTSKLMGKLDAYSIPNIVTSDRNFTITPEEMIGEVSHYSTTPDFALLVNADNSVVVASIPKNETEIFYSNEPLNNQFFVDYFNGKLEASFSPMDSVQIRHWANKAETLEEGEAAFQMGLTAFGKPGDEKYNKDSLTDTIMEDNKEPETNTGNINGGISDAELAMIESLAQVEHEQWKEWASSLMESEPNISAKRLERWRAYMVPYESLPGNIKEKDRDYAKKVLDVFKTYLKRRIAEKNKPV